MAESASPHSPRYGKRTLPKRSCIALQINCTLSKGSMHSVLFNQPNLTRHYVSRCVDHRRNALTVINTETGFNLTMFTQTICTCDSFMTG